MSEPVKWEDAEIAALASVHAATCHLDFRVRRRILEWAFARMEYEERKAAEREAEKRGQP